jgi:transposase
VTLEDKVHAFRLRLFRRAEELGNISAACREAGISRSLYYQLRGRFERYGSDGLHPKHRQGRPGRPPLLDAQIERRILAEALAAREGFYSKDNVLVTMRAQNAVVLIHWPTRRIVWSWGHGELVGPHDGNVLPNGNILIFDNGNEKRRSRVVELDPLAKEIVWEYKGHDFFSKNAAARSASQRVCSSEKIA